MTADSWPEIFFFLASSPREIYSVADKLGFQNPQRVRKYFQDLQVVLPTGKAKKKNATLLRPKTRLSIGLFNFFFVLFPQMLCEGHHLEHHLFQTIKILVWIHQDAFFEPNLFTIVDNFNHDTNVEQFIILENSHACPMQVVVHQLLVKTAGNCVTSNFQCFKLFLALHGSVEKEERRCVLLRIHICTNVEVGEEESVSQTRHMTNFLRKWQFVLTWLEFADMERLVFVFWVMFVFGHFRRIAFNFSGKLHYRSKMFIAHLTRITRKNEENEK